MGFVLRLPPLWTSSSSDHSCSIPYLIARYGASVRNPRTGLKRTFLLSLTFLVLYVFGVIHLYFRLA